LQSTSQSTSLNGQTAGTSDAVQKKAEEERNAEADAQAAFNSLQL
jgi:hypothetical protein